MNERDALDIVQQAIWTIIVASGPAVGAAMLVGIVIALLQALTQVQEMTLTFIPKIVVIFDRGRRHRLLHRALIFPLHRGALFGRIERGFWSADPRHHLRASSALHDAARDIPRE